MNTPSYTIALAAMLVGSVSAQSEFLKRAIEQGKLDVLRTCIETSYIISLQEKQNLANLAQRMIAKKKEDAEKDSSPKFKTLDWIEFSVAALAIAAGAKASYDEYTDEPDMVNGKAKYSVWKSWPIFLISVTKCADIAVKVVKASIKDDNRAKDAIENAEKIAQTLEEIEVE